MHGTHIVLSGIINSEDNASDNPYWRNAEKFGSVVSREITEETTHVIANSYGTKKTKLATLKGICVLHLLWLHLSIGFWYRLSEDFFKFENIENFEIKSILAMPGLKRYSIQEEVKLEKKTKNQSSKENSESESESDAEITDE